LGPFSATNRIMGLQQRGFSARSSNVEYDKKNDFYDLLGVKTDTDAK